MTTELPRAKKIPRTFTFHGDTRTDEYSWLQDRKSPATREHLRRENEYADAVMGHTKGMRAKLYKEMRARVTENDMSVPVKDGPYEYFTKTKRGKQYAIHYRRRGRRGKAEIILDENILAKGASFFSLGIFQVSIDHRYLAYSTDTNGSEKFTLFIKDLATGKLLDDRIEEVSDLVWAADSKTFLYTKENHPYPPRIVLCHAVGTNARDDSRVYEEKDVQWYVALSKSRDHSYIFITSGNFDTTEVRFLRAQDPTAEPRMLAARKARVKCFAEHYAGDFFILTNENAVNFKILRAPTANPAKKHWKTWLAHDPKRALTGFSVYRDFFFLTAREGGAEQAYTSPHERPILSLLKLPEAEHVIYAWGELSYESRYARITYQSLVSPRTVFDYYPHGRKLRVRKRQKVPRWNSSAYVSRRLWVKSDDVLVPVTIAHKKDARPSRSSPLLLEAYGSYGISLDPVFSITKISLLERGWVVAIAHPRGGGEMGWDWHKRAKLLKKHNTYRDVIAVADYLVKKKYTSHGSMALAGGSAGGMMVGAVLNMRPELFAAAIAYVPAADTLTSMLDTTLAGTRLHYDEIGDPRKLSHYRYVKKWSPYEAVHRAPYPALLVRASLNDIRTPYWEAAKWVARLRDNTTSRNPILFKVELRAGHFGKSGRYAWIKEKAFDYAFLFDRCTSTL